MVNDGDYTTPANDSAVTADLYVRFDGLGIGSRLEEDVKSGKIKVDFRGHFHGYVSGWFNQCIVSTFLFPSQETRKAIEILKNRAAGKDDRRQAIFGSSDSLLNHFDCNSCLQAVKFKVLKSKIIATTECPHPDGYPAYSVRINVPSGKLIFGNDFRDLIDVAASYDINRTLGCEQTTRAYADAGMIHVFVGNTCPGVFQVSDTRINIVSPERRSAGEEQDYIDLPTKEPKGKLCGSICTDLWWYSAMDYDLFKKLAKKKYGKKWKDRISRLETIVKVKPGCYKATAQTHRVMNDGHTTEDGGYYSPEEMFSFIKRDGDVRDLRTQSAHDQTVEFMKDFENAVKVKRLAWPTLYPTRDRVLEQWFCVVGNGEDWLDGAIVSVSEREEEAVARLKNGEKVTWDEEREIESHRSYYPMSHQYSALTNIPDNVRPDWLAGAREMIRYIIEHGKGPEDGERYMDNKRNIALAKAVEKQLNERFGPE